MIKIKNISTEKQNKNTLSIDIISTKDLVKKINDQDKKVAIVIEKQLENIAKVIDLGTKCIKSGGRIIYLGSGTSGRLGILDASEILPTFGEKDLFVGLIAGGNEAIKNPVENAEDNKKFAISDLKKINFSKKDFLIGISASGRTPYVVAGLEYAKNLGAITGSISTSLNSKISKIANSPIEAFTGPEVITGSTRMKSGTAQKMILNMISTGIMVKIGKTYSNLMVDLKPTNKKLISRATKMVSNIANVDDKMAKKLLDNADNNVKVAVVMKLKKVNKENAKNILKKNNGFLRNVIESNE